MTSFEQCAEALKVYKKNHIKSIFKNWLRRDNSADCITELIKLCCDMNIKQRKQKVLDKIDQILDDQSQSLAPGFRILLIETRESVKYFPEAETLNLPDNEAMNTMD